MMPMLRVFFLALFLLPLAACNDVSTPPPRSLTFSGYQPIYFNVSNIEVVEEYQSPMRQPNVEHLMPASPADAVQLWVKQRMRASGGTKRMQVIVKDGSVVEKQLPTEGGVTGFFKSEVNREYNARLEIEIRIYGDAALSEANVNVVGTRKLTLTESDNVEIRDAKFRDMIREMMVTINAELEKNIYKNLSPYIDYSRNG